MFPRPLADRRVPEKRGILQVHQIPGQHGLENLAVALHHPVQNDLLDVFRARLGVLLWSCRACRGLRTRRVRCRRPMSKVRFSSRTSRGVRAESSPMAASRNSWPQRPSGISACARPPRPSCAKEACPPSRPGSRSVPAGGQIPGLVLVAAGHQGVRPRQNEQHRENARSWPVHQPDATGLAAHLVGDERSGVMRRWDRATPRACWYRQRSARLIPSGSTPGPGRPVPEAPKGSKGSQGMPRWPSRYSRKAGAAPVFGTYSAPTGSLPRASRNA